MAVLKLSGTSIEKVYLLFLYFYFRPHVLCGSLNGPMVMVRWRNRIACETTNLEVLGSSPRWIENAFFSFSINRFPNKHNDKYPLFASKRHRNYDYFLFCSDSGRCCFRAAKTHMYYFAKHGQVAERNDLRLTPAIFSHTGQIHDASKTFVKEQVRHKLIAFEGEAKRSKVRSYMNSWV